MARPAEAILRKLEASGIGDILRSIVEKTFPFFGNLPWLPDFAGGKRGRPANALAFCLEKTRKFHDNLRQEDGSAAPVPHMGWNGIRKVGQSRILEGIADNAEFYFVHSYYRNRRKKWFWQPLPTAGSFAPFMAGRPMGGPVSSGKNGRAGPPGCWPISMPGAREKDNAFKTHNSCLDVRDGRLTKGVQFAGNRGISAILLRLPGAIMKKARMKSFFYDITASAEGRGIFLDVVGKGWLPEIFYSFQRWRRHLQCCRDEGSAVGWR